MRFIFQFIAVCAIIFSLLPISTYAHVTKTDGEISILLHIDPNDSPAATKRSAIYFELSDKTNRFKASNCNCILSIYTDKQNLINQKLNLQDGNKEFSFDYIFPEIGIYYVEIVGRSLNETFQSFDLKYDVRVAGSGTSGAVLNKNPWVIGGLIMLTISAIFLIRNIKRQV